MSFSSAIIDTEIDTGIATTEQTITSPGFGTPDAAIFILCDTVTDNTAVDNVALCVGFTDGVTHSANAFQANDASATTDTAQHNKTDAVIYKLVGNSGSHTLEAIASFKEWTTDGVIITIDDQFPSAYVLKVILIKCDNAKVIQQDIGSGAEDVTLGFQADVVIAYINDVNNTGGTQARMSVGFASDEGGILQAAHETFWRDNTATNEIISQVETGLIGAYITTSSKLAEPAFDITSFNATAINVDHVNRGSSSARWVQFLALDIGDNDSWVGILDAPTSAGSSTWAQTGPGFRPQFVMMLPTLIDTVTSNKQNDQAELMAISIFNDTDEACVHVSGENGETNSNCEQMMSDKAVNVNSGDGTPQYVATLTTMDANGFTLEFTTKAPTTARKWPVLAIEQDAVVGGDAKRSFVPAIIG